MTRSRGAILSIVGPGAVTAALAAEKEAGQRRDQVHEALDRDLEVARYAADRAFRQYDAADPANRLVAGELEVRLEQGACSGPGGRSENNRPPCRRSQKHLDSAHTTDARLKKRVVRTLIHEIVADIDDQAAEVILIVHWIGGLHSEIRLPRRRRGQRNSTPADIIRRGPAARPHSE